MPFKIYSYGSELLSWSCFTSGNANILIQFRLGRVKALKYFCWSCFTSDNANILIQFRLGRVKALKYFCCIFLK